MRFSQRQGINPASKTLQIEAIDGELRNGLWDAIQLSYFATVKYDTNNWGIAKRCDRWPLLIQYWHNFFKTPIDTIPRKFDDAEEAIRDFFFCASFCRSPLISP